MAKRQWFGWVVHARQERGDYMALLAIITTFAVGMIAVGSYLAASEKRQFPHWLSSTLLIAGISILLMTVVAALVLGALPFFTRPKLRLGELSMVPYSDVEVDAKGVDNGGIRRAVCVQVEVLEQRGVKAREVEVWLTAFDPEIPALPVALPVPIAAFDLSNSTVADISPKNRRYFKLWVTAEFNNGQVWSVSRIGIPFLDNGAFTLEIHHESWTPDTRTYRIPEDLVRKAGTDS